MALEKRTELGMMTILADGQIQLREDTVVLDDGVEIARLYHRRVLEPGVETKDETHQRLKDVATVVWTADVVTAFEQKKLERDTPPVLEESPADTPLETR